MSNANRLSSLRKKLASRDGIPGYEKNCEMIKAEIARLENLEMTTSPKPLEELSGPVSAVTDESGNILGYRSLPAVASKD